MSIELELVTQCTGCDIFKTLDDFSPNKNAYFGNQSQCHECHNKRTREYRNTFNGFMKQLIDSARKNARTRSVKGRTDAGSFDLTFEYVIAIWNQQNGKCYYSGIQMNPRPCSNWQCSIERLNNDFGYIPGNIAFVCLEFNGFAKWSPDKVKQVVISMNDHFDDASILADIDNALVKRAPQINRKPIMTNDIGQYICNSCNTYKNMTEFNSQINNGCKDCIKLKNISHSNTLRGHLQRLLKNAKSRSKQRDNVKNKTTDNTFAITFDDLVEMLRSQHGRCAYSNIKLKYGNTYEKDWVASLERIDPRKGYIKDNICLVCSEFNGTDHTTNIKYSNGGSGGWSIEKFKFFLDSFVNRQLELSGLISPYMLELINNPAHIHKFPENVQLEIIG